MMAFCLIFSLAACNTDDKQSSSKPENDIDAARDFIRDALDGKFEQARKLLLPDSSNTNYMDVAERNYRKADLEIKNGYRGSSINIHQVTPVNDSTTIIIYSNSFKNDHDTLKVLKVSGQWLVDLKYLYEHDMDTTQYLNRNKDSLK
jgi:Domain of unknown function (DUF4878)